MAKLIEPRIALAVARAVSADPGTGSTYLAQRLVRDLTVAVPRSEELVAAHSGIPAPPPVRWSVVDRPAWVEANIRAMNTMIAPLADRLGKIGQLVVAEVERRELALRQDVAGQCAQRASMQEDPCRLEVGGHSSYSSDPWTQMNDWMSIMSRGFKSRTSSRTFPANASRLA